MKLSNEVLIGTDGWFEYSIDAPSETADIAVSGWFDWGSGDEIVPPPSTFQAPSNKTMFFNVVINER